MSGVDATPDEVMTIGAARELVDGEVVLVGVGPPNAAPNLARKQPSDWLWWDWRACCLERSWT